MSILQHFKRKKSAEIVRDRLHIIIAQERAQANSPDYLPMLRQDILAVIAKYAKVDLNTIKVDLHRQENNAILEINLVLSKDDNKH